MSKGKSITLLSIISVIMAFFFVMTFIQFPIGANKNYVSVINAVQADYDLAGGTAYTYKLDHTSNPIEDVDSVLKTLNYRLNALGYQNSVVKALKNVDDGATDYSIRIETRALNNSYGEQNKSLLESDLKVVMAYGELKFMGGTSSNPDTEIFTTIANPVKSVSRGDTTTYNGNVYYTVSITFSDAAYAELESAINAASSYYLAISLGETTLFSDAVTQSMFNKKSINIYPSNESYANQVVLQIQSGGLAYKFDLDNPEVEDISSVYGACVYTVLKIAVAVILVALIVAMAITYKGYALISGLSMIGFMLIELWMLIAIPGIKLSIGGVVGILLATVLAADGMIVTAKRISEEYIRGKTVKAAVKTGFKRALLPVISTNAIVAMVSLALIALTGGQVKYFAITLGIGAAASAIAALLFTRMFTAVILPLVKKKDCFLNLKRDGLVAAEGEAE